MMSRAATLSADNRQIAAKKPSFVRKVVLLGLLAAASALGLVILQRRTVGAPLAIFNIFADASLGVVVGMGSRMVFRHRHWLMRTLLAAAFAIFGLIVLGQITGGGSGIGPLHLQQFPLDIIGRHGINVPFPSPLSSGQQLLVDVAHMVLAASIAWITLRAWNGGHRVSVSSPPPRPALEPRVPQPAKPLPIDVLAPKPARIPRVQRQPRLQLRARKAPAASLLIRAPKARTTHPARRWRSFLGGKPGVRLATHEEHRCPYCLEPVQRNGPRGSVECPICHTLHHKDCWDVTGTCQVPHLTV
jgi:hypothetical protein